jgi:TIR domain
MTRGAKKSPVKKKVGAAKKSLYRVFISHSSLDKWIAGRMAEKITESGADFWLDTRDLPGGGDIRSEISKGVNDSHEIVILLSPNSKDSPWVSFEIGAAFSKRRYLTPILNNVKYSEMVLIQNIKAVELNDFEQYLSELKKRISKWARKQR